MVDTFVELQYTATATTTMTTAAAAAVATFGCCLIGLFFPEITQVRLGCSLVLQRRIFTY